MLLSGKELAQETKIQLIEQRKKYFGDREVYVAIVFLGENNPSQVYVNSKIKYAKELGMECRVFGGITPFRKGGSEGNEQGDFSTIDSVSLTNPLYLPLGKGASKEEIQAMIHQLNEDDECIGIIVQLPLPEYLKADKDTICAAVHPMKDIDGLGGILCGRNQLGLISFQPATAKAVLELWKYHNLGEMKGLKIAVIGQSNVVGKPLAIECLKRGACVQTFTDVDSKETIANFCQKSDVIISCTGAIHLVDKECINPNRNQIVIDVGYGFLDGKAAGDVKFDEVAPLVKAISPVPGGVGPLTVASLFANIFMLQEQKEIIEELWKNLVG